MINEDRGGLWDTSEMGAASWAIFYVQVEDVRAAIDRAQELGAAVVVPYVDNGAIEFAHLTDPLGNRFGIWRPKAAQ
jgi:predicted enzyme related to lactoylglutathione lyase